MLRENNIIIDPNKSAEFLQFLRTSGKTKEFWNKNKEIASTPIDKAELNSLFEEDDT